MNLAAALVRKSLSLAQGMVQPYAEGAMNSLVVITRKGVYNADEGEYDPGATVTVYADSEDPTIGAMAGITSTSSSGSMDLGDEPAYFDTITVMIPRGSLLPRIDDDVHVMAAPDTNLINRHFRVISVPAGGRLFPSITLTCSGVAPSRQWNVSS